MAFRTIVVSFLALVTFACSTPSEPAKLKVHAPKVKPASEIDLRLRYLENRLDAERQDQHVPGLALAIVKDDKVLWVKGLGVSNRETKAPVTGDTVFAIGSTTKAFTSTLVAMQVAKQQLQFDDPIEKYLPELRLQTTGKDNARPTIADLLSHRTGFPRMSLVWASGKLSLPEIYGFVSKAEPTAALGTEFQYNNVLYASAGEASARVANTDWQSLVKQQIFEPLAMSSTSASLKTVIDKTRLAQGYSYIRTDKRFKHETPRDIAAVAPAGSIHSTANDMAKWVRLLVNQGTTDGKTLYSPATVAPLYTKQIAIPGGIAYGMGWMLKTWKGQRFIEHGGNIDGYAASVGFLPDSKLGYVLLTNTSWTTLQEAIGPLVFDALLTDAYKTKPAANVADADKLIGAYRALVPSLAAHGETVQVLVKDGKLAVDVPGQTVFSLQPPDASGKRYFEITNTIAVEFTDFDQNGRANVLVLHQGGIAIEFPRKDFLFPGKLSQEAANKLVGRFQPDDGKGPSVEIVQDAGLALVKIGGQFSLYLEPEAKAGKFHFRSHPKWYVTIDGTTLIWSAMGRNAKLKRDTSYRLPTLADIVKLRKTKLRARNAKRFVNRAIAGEVWVPQSGLRGKAKLYIGSDGRFYAGFDFGKAGYIRTIVGKTVRTETAFDDHETLTGARAELARVSHPLALAGDWDDYFSGATVLGITTEGKRKRYRVRLQTKATPVDIEVDAKTGDVVSSISREPSDFGPTMAIKTEYSGFRSRFGLRIPGQFSIDVPQSGKMIVTLKQVRRATEAEMVELDK